MTYVFQDLSQMPKDRVVGANHIDTVRLRYILTRKNYVWGNDPAFVCGPHDDKMFAYFATPHRVPPIIQEKIDGAVEEVVSYAPKMVQNGTGTEHAVAAAVTEMVRAGQHGGIIGASTFGTLRDFLPRFTDPQYFPSFYDVDPDPGIYMGWPITFKDFKADPVQLAIFSHDLEITRIKDAYKHIVQLLTERTTPQIRAKFERQAVASTA